MPCRNYELIPLCFLYVDLQLFYFIGCSRLFDVSLSLATGEDVLTVLRALTAVWLLTLLYLLSVAV